VQDLIRVLKQHKMLAKTMKRAGKGGLGGMQQLLGNAMGGSARGPGRGRRR
jgi:hypothetical protein